MKKSKKVIRPENDCRKNPELCKEWEVCNPDSGRCVHKSGVLGLKIQGKDKNGVLLDKGNDCRKDPKICQNKNRKLSISPLETPPEPPRGTDDSVSSR